MTDTQQKIIDFIKSFPNLKKIEEEAGLPQGKLSDKRHKWNKKTLAKVLKVVEKYGFNRSSQQYTK